MTADNNKDKRAGRYLGHPGGYDAFIPRDLPPAPPLEIDDELFDLLSRADRALGRLDCSTESLPNPDLFVAMYVRKEAVLSSQIKGTQASLIDVLEFEADADRSNEIRDVREVVNYVDALNHGLERLQDLPVSLRLIREIHGRLLEGVRGGERNPGEFRTSQNWIGPPGSTLANAFYVPPPPEVLKDHLGALQEFVHSDAPRPILITAALVHAQFETIHPFLDGNGRVGRLLITFLLCEREILKKPLLYISHFFRRNQQEYYDRLQAVRDRGEWEKWIKFFLEAVFRVSQEATETARQVIRLREAHRERISSQLGRRASGALSLHEHLFLRPIVTVDSVRKLTGLSYSNANNLISRLEGLGLLRETTGQKRNRRFSYAPYLELFSE